MSAMIKLLEKMLAEARAERDTLAAQVVAMLDMLQPIADNATSTDDGWCGDIVEEVFDMDTTQAESILRERDARTLEEVADEFESSWSDRVYISELRRMAADRRNAK
jgi:hypothetical protein